MPQKIKTVTIGEVLTEEQLKTLTALINKLSIAGVDKMSSEYIDELKAFCWEIKDTLEEKSLLPDYFAYVLLNNLVDEDMDNLRKLRRR